MPHAIVQTDIAPTVDQLKRAFRSLKALTEADVVKRAIEACGILLKNLTLAEAGVLQRALQAEGVATEIVEMDELPKLTEGRFVRRMEIQPESLLIYDPLGRPLPLPWQHLALVSAGEVRHFEMSASRTEQTVRTFNPISGFRTKVVEEVRHKVDNAGQLILEIFLTGGAMRIQSDAASLMFKYCFDRPDLAQPQKLALLIEMLNQHAPHARLNRGATALLEARPEHAAYASKAALFDESIWWMWRLSRT